MHAAGFAEKQAGLRRHDGMEHRRIRPAGVHILECILQRRQSRIAGMRTLHRLFELHLITEQDQIIRASRHRDGVGQGHLPGFVDEEKIERAFPLGPGKEPGRSADDSPAIRSLRAHCCLGRIAGLDWRRTICRLFRPRL